MSAGTNYIYLASSRCVGDVNSRQYDFYNRCASKVVRLGAAPGTTGPAPVYGRAFLVIC
jgi:hypothetical protein